ncbi:hypothetical protein [Roseateles sp. LYH14W]|uniref:Uncharacterized protein n=1 Tax=Pelomonas parva TaxID=3299032 RepID=A0ABW7FB75_9BURK
MDSLLKCTGFPPFQRLKQQTFQRKLTATAEVCLVGRPQRAQHQSLRQLTGRVSRRLLHARQREFGG